MTYELGNLSPTQDFMILNNTEPKVFKPEALAALPFRYDIEGLRAVAVLAIIGFHLKFSWLRGGFVGVDAFFVISGYLITGVLTAELDKTGRINPQNFYGKRARRLLPTLLLVTGSMSAISGFFSSGSIILHRRTPITLFFTRGHFRPKCSFIFYGPSCFWSQAA